MNVIDLDKTSEEPSDESYNSDKAINDVVRDTIEQSNQHELEFKRLQSLEQQTKDKITSTTSKVRNKMSVVPNDLKQ